MVISCPPAVLPLPVTDVMVGAAQRVKMQQHTRSKT
jgi:hypothetical protein